MSELTERWRKSSYSAQNGACVEWRKSTRSADTANCVEVGPCDCTGETVIQVRDSKLGDVSPILTFTPQAMAAFVGAVKAGAFG